MQAIKFNIPVLLTLFLLGVVSCSKVNELTSESTDLTHTISVSTAPVETKTAVAVDMNNHTTVFSWSGDDYTRLVIKENGVVGTISNFTIDANGLASFQASFPTSSPAPDSYEYTGFLAGTKTSGGYPRIPNQQYPTATSYDPDADVMYAKPITTTSLPSSFTMQYQRAVAITRLTLSGLPNNKTIDKIYIDGGSTKITGAFTMSQDFSINMIAYDSRIELSLPGGSVTSNNEITTYFTMLPLQDVVLTVIAHSTDGYVYAKTLTPKSFTARQVKALTVTNLASFIDGNISFEDSNVKSICVNNWDANHDGELSYQEAAAVTSVGTVFQWNEEISVFGEFQYFTGITHLDDSAFTGCAKLTSIILPISLTSIGNYAFSSCGYKDPAKLAQVIAEHPDDPYMCWTSDTFDYGLGAIDIPSGVTTIGDGAFRETPLHSISLPNGLTSIGSEAFAYSELSSINLPATITFIGDGAFYSSRIYSIILPPNITTIGDGMFGNCMDLQEITLPTDLKIIGEGVFSECISLASITIPQSVTSIGDAAFFDCRALTNITIPLGVTTINRCTFSACQALSSISIPSAVTSIEEYAFQNCTALSTVTMPGVTSIGNEAFWYCSSLSEITIPSGVTSIGQRAFAYCTSLDKAILVPVTPPTIGSNCWENTTCYFYVPSNSVSTYQLAAGWSEYASRIYDVWLMP